MTGQPQPYQPLTSDNAAVVLVDHQVGLMTGVRDYYTGELKHNVVALAKAAKALKLPIVATTTARDSMWGPTFPELVDAPRRRSNHRSFFGQLLGRSQGLGRDQGHRPQETDLRRHFP
jgi:nicotinamidase-related amidase